VRGWVGKYRDYRLGKYCEVTAKLLLGGSKRCPSL